MSTHTCFFSIGRKKAELKGRKSSKISYFSFISQSTEKLQSRTIFEVPVVLGCICVYAVY